MRRSPRLLAPLLLASALSAPVSADPEPSVTQTRSQASPGAQVPAEPPYPLDTLSRDAPPEGEDLDCSRVEVQSYRGDVIRYRPEVWVNASFRERLAAFERVVRDVGVEVYGRAPDRILQVGGYGCRRMRDHPTLLSEHALGNAIDVAGFEFGHLPRGARLPEGLPGVFANGFEVHVLGHWGKKSGYAAVHARFLRTLVQRLAGRDDVFRVLLGPGYPGHTNHFHFDMATFRLVQIFEDGRLITAPKVGAPTNPGPAERAPARP